MADKEMEDLKKQMANEVKVFNQKTQKDCKEAKELRDEAAELAKKKDQSDQDKKRTIDIRKTLQDLEKSYLAQANSTSGRLTQMLKNAAPTDPKAVPEWQKGMAPWYRDLIEKEAGLDLGRDVKLSGEISIKDKRVMLKLNGKFSNP